MNWKNLLLRNVPRGGDGASGETSAADTESYGLSPEGGGLTAENTGGWGGLNSEVAAGIIGEAAAGNFGYASDALGGSDAFSAAPTTDTLSAAIGPADIGGFGLSGIAGLSPTAGIGPSVSAPFGGMALSPESVPDYEGAPGMGLGGTSLGFSGFPGSMVDVGNITPTAIDVSMEQPFAEDVAQAAQVQRDALAAARDAAARARDEAVSLGLTDSQARAAANRAFTDAISRTQDVTIGTQVPSTMTNQQIAAMMSAPSAPIGAPVGSPVGAPVGAFSPAAPSAPVGGLVGALVGAPAPTSAVSGAVAAPVAPSALPDIGPSPPTGRPEATTAIGLTDVLADPSKMGSYLSERLASFDPVATGVNFGLAMVPGVGPVVGLANIGLSLAGQPTIGGMVSNARAGLSGVTEAGENVTGFEGVPPAAGVASFVPPTVPAGIASLTGAPAPVAYNLASFQPAAQGVQSLSAATPSPAFNPYFVASTPSPAFNVAAPLSRPQYV